MWCCGAIGGRVVGMTLCHFLNPAVPLGERVRHDLGVTFAGAYNFSCAKLLVVAQKPGNRNEENWKLKIHRIIPKVPVQNVQKELLGNPKVIFKDLGSLEVLLLLVLESAWPLAPAMSSLQRLPSTSHCRATAGGLVQSSGWKHQRPWRGDLEGKEVVSCGKADFLARME